METKMFNTYEEMSRCLAQEVVDCLAKNPRMTLCVAAGHTSLGLLSALVDAYKNGSADFSNASFVSMDEWAGMTVATPGSCGEFLTKNFLNHVNYSAENIRLIDGTAADPAAECLEHEKFIAEKTVNGVIDFLVLGSGMNGHLAFNEPGTPLTARARFTPLDTVTCTIGQKYFDSKMPLNSGLTLGLANFGEAKRTVLIVNGAHKRVILAKILKSPYTAKLPATALKVFENASIYYDKSAAYEM